MTTLSMEKGERVSLEKEAPGVVKFRVGLAWDPNKGSSAHDFDLDAAAFVLKPNASSTDSPNVLLNNTSYCYFGQKNYANAISLSGDNLTGAGEGDDEVISLDLSKVPAEANEIAFFVVIYQARNRNQNFGMVPKSSIAVYEDGSNKVVAKYNLTEDYSTATAVHVGSIYKRDDATWGFKAVGQGFKGDLHDIRVGYGYSE